MKLAKLIMKHQEILIQMRKIIGEQYLTIKFQIISRVITGIKNIK